MFPEGMLISVTLVIDRSRLLSRNEYASDYFSYFANVYLPSLLIFRLDFI